MLRGLCLYFSARGSFSRFLVLSGHALVFLNQCYDRRFGKIIVLTLSCKALNLFAQSHQARVTFIRMILGISAARAFKIGLELFFQHFAPDRFPALPRHIERPIGPCEANML